MSETRRLSTILFADIVGYTAMMQEDEGHALSLLNSFKAILEEIVPGHEGEIIQYFGDGCLLSFASAINAVLCGLLFNGISVVQVYQSELACMRGMWYSEGIICLEMG